VKQFRINIKWYLLADIAVCIITWFCFYYLRTVIYDYNFRVPPGFYLGLLIYTAGWISLHFMAGTYDNIYQKSGTSELFRTFTVSLIGCLFLLFFFVLKNPHTDNSNYYMEFLSLLIPNFLIILFVRLVFADLVKNQLNTGKVFFNTLLVGSSEKARQFYESFLQTADRGGLRITGFYHVNNHPGEKIAGLTYYESPEDLLGVMKKENTEEIIVAIEKNERDLLTHILRELSDKEVNIKITADTLDIITGAVQTNNIKGIPLIDIHSGMLPAWQQNAKRISDLFICLLAICLLWPLFLYIMIRVAFSSPGPVFFRQERIGFKGKPFTMYKFRSMIVNAEPDGPRLSSRDDERITRWGRIMRKWRMDELPQLWNVIKGEMSLVGPRPERKYYIERITALRPEYKYLFKVKPGITSWGMVNFGYAGSVEEMISRMPYDLLYVENASLALDYKILFYTIRTIFSGKGQ
jgi:exopolysaccharide biosynthesis polyprenyl glycosylphosphotransferase